MIELMAVFHSGASLSPTTAPTHYHTALTRYYIASTHYTDTLPGSMEPKFAFSTEFSRVAWRAPTVTAPGRPHCRRARNLTSFPRDIMSHRVFM